MELSEWVARNERRITDLERINVSLVRDVARLNNEASAAAREKSEDNDQPQLPGDLGPGRPVRALGEHRSEEVEGGGA
jgi:hypothetical protein